jgi:hypothetical protein
MKGNTVDSAGAPGRVPLRDGETPVNGVLSYSKAASNPSQSGLGSVDFQTRRLADPPESAEREAAFEVGLETCAAAGERAIVAHNLSLSAVLCCHR